MRENLWLLGLGLFVLLVREGTCSEKEPSTNTTAIESPNNSTGSSPGSASVKKGFKSPSPGWGQPSGSEADHDCAPPDPCASIFPDQHIETDDSWMDELETSVSKAQREHDEQINQMHVEVDKMNREAEATHRRIWECHNKRHWAHGQHFGGGFGFQPYRSSPYAWHHTMHRPHGQMHRAKELHELQFQNLHYPYFMGPASFGHGGSHGGCSNRRKSCGKAKGKHSKPCCKDGFGKRKHHSKVPKRK